MNKETKNKPEHTNNGYTLSVKQSLALCRFYEVVKARIDPDSTKTWQRKQQIAWAWINAKYAPKFGLNKSIEFEMLCSVGTDKKFFNWLTTEHFHNLNELCSHLLEQIKNLINGDEFISDLDWSVNEKWLTVVMRDATPAGKRDVDNTENAFVQFIANFCLDLVPEYVADQLAKSLVLN